MKIVKKLWIWLLILALCISAWYIWFKYKNNNISNHETNENHTTWNDTIMQTGKENTEMINEINTIDTKDNEIEKIEGKVEEKVEEYVEDKKEEKENEIKKENTISIIESNIEKEQPIEKNNTNEYNQTEIKFVEYEDKTHNFKITIPIDRTFQDDIQWFDLKLNSPKNDEINENIWIKVQELQTEESLKSFTETTTKWLKNLYNDFKEIKQENINVNGIEGTSLIYEMSDNWYELKAKQTVFLKENKSYIFQYTATKQTFDQYIDEINNIINSFTILN